MKLEDSIDKVKNKISSYIGSLAYEFDELFNVVNDDGMRSLNYQNISSHISYIKSQSHACVENPQTADLVAAMIVLEIKGEHIDKILRPEDKDIVNDQIGGFVIHATSTKAYNVAKARTEGVVSRGTLHVDRVSKEKPSQQLPREKIAEIGSLGLVNKKGSVER